MRKSYSAILIFGLVLLFSSAYFSQTKNGPEVRRFYDAETNKTALYLSVIPFPNNSKKFSVGGAFEIEGERTSKLPCCMTIVLTSIGKKGFDYENDHRVIFWADGQEMIFDDAIWKESEGATAFVIAGIAFPEEVWIGMKTDQFLKIANAKTAKGKIGKFKFVLTTQQKMGLIALSEEITESVKK